MALVIVDFDLTIVNGHTHNKIFRTQKFKGQLNQDEHWNLIKDFSVIGPTGQWKLIFETLLNQGHEVCIASFNSYGHIIPRFLREKVGLSANEVEKIKLVSWLPNNPRSANKNQHIAQAINELGFEGQKSEVILIDDTLKNTDAAKREGYQVIPADREGKFLENILSLISSVEANNPQTNNPQSTVLTRISPSMLAYVCYPEDEIYDLPPIPSPEILPTVPTKIQSDQDYSDNFKNLFYTQLYSERFLFIKKCFSKTLKKIEDGCLDTKEAIENHINEQPHSRAAIVYKQMLADNPSETAKKDLLQTNALPVAGGYIGLRPFLA